MNKEIVKALSELIRRKGPEIVGDVPRCEALIRDFCAGPALWRNLLIQALKAGCPAVILQERASKTWPELLLCLTKRMEEEFAIREDYAQWSIKTWSVALDQKHIGKSEPHHFHSREQRVADNVFSTKQSEAAIVAKSGPCDFRTISEALKRAQPRSQIVIRPGTYLESLVLEKEVELIGEGDQAAIVIQSNDSFTIEVSCSQAALRNLRIINTAPQQTCEAAVQIFDGSLLMNNCEVTSEFSAGIHVEGTDSSCAIRNSKIHDSAIVGVRFVKGATGSMEECEVFNNRDAGIYCASANNPIICRCKIHDSTAGCGVEMANNSTGTIEDCEIFSNKLSGIKCHTGGNPTVLRSRIYGSRGGCGVSVHENGAGISNDCEIFKNKFSNVQCQSGGNPTVKKCKIHGSDRCGVQIADCGTGTFEDCEIFNNKLSGVQCDSGGNPRFLRCKMYDSQESRGILILDNGTGTFINCELFNNKYPDVDDQRGAKFINCKWPLAKFV